MSFGVDFVIVEERIVTERLPCWWLRSIIHCLLMICTLVFGHSVGAKIWSRFLEELFAGIKFYILHGLRWGFILWRLILIQEAKGLLSHRLNHNLLILPIMVTNLLVVDWLKHVVPLLVRRLQPWSHFPKACILVAHVYFIFLFFVLLNLIQRGLLIQPVNLVLRLSREYGVLPFINLGWSHRGRRYSLNSHFVFLLRNFFNQRVHL